MKRVWRALQERLAWVLPRHVVYHAIVRAGAHATTGQWSGDSPTEVTLIDVMKRWGDE